MCKLKTKEEIIYHILENSNRLRESYIKKRFTLFYDDVKYHNIKYNLPREIKFLEKLWYYINSVTQMVMCESCGENPTTFESVKRGYRKTCTANCSRRKKPRPRNETVDMTHILEKQRRMAESYIKTHFRYIYDNILNYIKVHDLPTDIEFREKLWYYYNKITVKKTCGSCKGEVKFDVFDNGYKDYCSTSCYFDNYKKKPKPIIKTCNEKKDIEYILEYAGRLHENYILRNFKYIHDNVINYNIKHNLPINITFKEKLWYYNKNVTEKVVCKSCKENDVTFNSVKKGYKSYCSTTCSITKKTPTPIIVEKTEEKVIEHISEHPVRLRKRYIKNHHRSLYNNILNYIDKHELPTDIEFIEKLWYYVNKKTEKVVCIQCEKNDVTFDTFERGYRNFCSSECGVRSPLTKKKAEEKSFKKWGYKKPTMHPDVKKRAKETSLKTYNEVSSALDPTVKAKQKVTLMKNHGVDHPFKSEKVKSKIRETTKKKYDKEYYTQTDEYKIRVVKTNNEKYNKDYYTQTDEYKKQVKATNLQEHGVEHFFQSDSYKHKLDSFLKDNKIDHLGQLPSVIDKNKKSHLSKRIKNFYKKGYYCIDKEDDYLTLMHTNPEEHCKHIFKINRQVFNNRRKNEEVVCTKCNNLNQNISKMEIELQDFVKSILPSDENIITNDRKTLGNNFELDIYVPNKNIALEFNGLYWHSEAKDKYEDYHIGKTERCEKLDIDLIHIWEDDWTSKCEIVKSYIRNHFNIYSNRICYSDCMLEIIKDDTILEEFLNENNIHDYNVQIADINIGLMYNNNLISVLSINEHSNYSEIVSYTNILNTYINYGFDYMFEHYINGLISPNIKHVYSSIKLDIDIPKNLYLNNNFKYNKRLEPDYKWVIDYKRYNKNPYSLEHLISYKNISIDSFMDENNNPKIWDCGIDKYTYTLNT